MAKKLFKHDKHDEFKDYFLFVYLIIMVGIVPTIVRLKTYVFVTNSEWELMPQAFSEGNFVHDVFHYYKARIITIVSIVCAFFYLLSNYSNLKTKKLELKNTFKKPIVIAFLVFIFCVLISTVFGFTDVSLRGAATRYEHWLVLLSYILIFYAAYDFTQNSKNANLFMWIVSLSAFYITGIGLFQFLGKDPFATNFFSRLVYASHYYPGATLTINFLGRIYTTLFNPNMAGVYGAMLLPVFAVCAVFFPVKHALKYVFVVLTGLTLVTLIGSGSASGFLGIAATFVVAVICVIIYLIKFRAYVPKKVYLFLLLAIIGVVLISFVPFVNKQIQNVATRIQKEAVKTHALKLPYYVDPSRYEPVRSVGFNGMEAFASGRGFIWSRSIPLLWDYFFRGAGVDSFALVFPNHDFIGKYLAYGTGNIFVDKAHNFYLQTAINTGFFSLLALLAVFAIYFWRTFSVLFSRYENDYKTLGLRFGIMLSVVAYLITMIANDSTPSVSPVFWGLLGLGYSLTSRDSSKNHKMGKNP